MLAAALLWAALLVAALLTLPRLLAELVLVALLVLLPAVLLASLLVLLPAALVAALLVLLTAVLVAALLVLLTAVLLAAALLASTLRGPLAALLSELAPVALAALLATLPARTGSAPVALAGLALLPAVLRRSAGLLTRRLSATLRLSVHRSLPLAPVGIVSVVVSHGCTRWPRLPAVGQPAGDTSKSQLKPGAGVRKLPAPPRFRASSPYLSWRSHASSMRG